MGNTCNSCATQDKEQEIATVSSDKDNKQHQDQVCHSIKWHI